MNEKILYQGGWRRMPLGGEKLSGFGRSLLYKMIRRGSITGKVIRAPGGTKGLIFVNIHEIDSLVTNAPDARAVFSTATKATPHTGNSA